MLLEYCKYDFVDEKRFRFLEKKRKKLESNNRYKLRTGHTVERIALILRSCCVPLELTICPAVTAGP